MLKFDAYSYLSQHGIKPSVQRQAIITYLYEHRTHPNVDDIFTALQPVIRTLSRTTIYNTLHLFHDHGAILALTINGETVHFDFNTQSHTHFYCLKCNKVFDVPEMECPTPTLPKKYDFEVTEYHFYLKGYCKQCKAENEKQL
ncbi:MAG: Fur family transcriptional regulator [Paludibacteraceae bacterium]|nr:Fur family transcriptional regulator [Paludibacteraceae bacterium]